MIFKNGWIFREDKTFYKGDLRVENGRIAEVAADCGPAGEGEVIDATGLYVLPGLIDIHSHGACGQDFSDGDAEGLRKILAYERAHGITSYCPTSMTLSRERLLRVFETGRRVAEEAPARVAGFNMEGPFLDPEKKGAHDEAYILKPDAEFFRECQAAAGGRIRLMTLAPNREGAFPFLEALGNQVHVSLGHTAADYETSRAAFQAGADHVTHLYNAMLPLHHREPGLIGAALDALQAMVELICDGIHVHESVVRSTFRSFPGRVVLISDSMRATGLADGVYDLGGQRVTVRGKLATLADGTIAGSVTNLYDCMRQAVAFGIPLEEAVAACTCNPARSIGIYDSVGSLTPGKRADILLADRDLNLVRVN